MKSFHLILFSLFIGITVSACDSGKPQGEGPTSDSVGQLAPPGDTSTAAQAQAPDTAKPIITQTATITTDMGDIVIGLYGQDAPKTAANFVGLAQKKFYDGIGFHRVVPRYVIQTGDPKSKDQGLYEEWGSGGESIYEKEFEDELDPNTPSARIGYVRGTVAMANRGPNTNTSQFFIVLTTEAATGLPHSYTIFGTVINGMDVVEKIEKAAVDDRGNPIEKPMKPVRIKSVAITEETPTIH